MKKAIQSGEYFKISANALKVMYFEAMCLHELEDDAGAIEIAKVKLGVGNIIYDMAVKESNLPLMLMVLDGANIVDDLDLVGKAALWVKDNTDTPPSSYIDQMVKAKGYIASNKEYAIQLALQADMKVTEGFEEMNDLVLMASDKLFTLNDLVY